MILFSPKGIRAWKSSGVSANNSKLEMSNFSFIEESFYASSSGYSMSIIGRNIIGNGNITISVYINAAPALCNDFQFGSTYHSKWIATIECNIGELIRVVISRGKRSVGRILIDHVAVLGFVIDKFVEEPIIEDIIPTIIDNIVSPVEVPVVIIKPKKKRKARTKKAAPDHVAQPVVIAIPKEKISAAIIDLNIINDERDIFNFINQINFGKNNQKFFVKQSQSDPKDFTKYQNVAMFNDEQDLLVGLANFDISRIFWNKGNIQGALLEWAETMKRAIS
jgi:hypothetical protein